VSRLHPTRSWLTCRGTGPFCLGCLFILHNLLTSHLTRARFRRLRKDNDVDYSNILELHRDFEEAHTTGMAEFGYICPNQFAGDVEDFQHDALDTMLPTQAADAATFAPQLRPPRAPSLRTGSSFLSRSRCSQSPSILAASARARLPLRPWRSRPAEAGGFLPLAPYLDAHVFDFPLT
jgi:hypothetical protein